MPPVPQSADPDALPRQTPWVTAGWMVHWVIRLILAGYLMIYGGVKLFRGQMGPLDYSQALTTFGEKSPMGLLWTFISYSPVLEIGAGALEVLAALLLLWRRTAWLGGLLAAVEMAVVFTLNMTHDVPVKTLSLALTVAGLMVAGPEIPRLLRFLGGRAVPNITLPQAVPWPRAHRFTRWTPLLLGVLALVPLIPMAGLFSTVGHNDSPLAGVYQVVRVEGDPGVDWFQVALGQHTAFRGEGTVTGHASVRETDGTLRPGLYDVSGKTVTISVSAPLSGADGFGFDPDTGEDLVFGFTTSDGDVVLSTGDGSLTLRRKPELTFLYDREFSWSNGAVNR